MPPFPRTVEKHLIIHRCQRVKRVKATLVNIFYEQGKQAPLHLHVVTARSMPCTATEILLHFLLRHNGLCLRVLLVEKLHPAVNVRHESIRLHFKNSFHYTINKMAKKECEKASPAPPWENNFLTKASDRCKKASCSSANSQLLQDRENPIGHEAHSYSSVSSLAVFRCEFLEKRQRAADGLCLDTIGSTEITGATEVSTGNE